MGVTPRREFFTQTNINNLKPNDMADETEKKEHLNLNQLKAEKGVLKIVHQEEETPRVTYAKPVELKGTIQAPGNFIEKRKSEHKALKANVQFSYRGLYIKLRTEEDADDSEKEAFYFVEGKLIENPDIKTMRLNTKQTLSVQEMIELIKFNRALFPNKEQNHKIVENLQRFKLTATSQIEAANDNRGNQKDLYEIKNDSNIDLGFDLMMPLYIGQPPKKFRVDILYNVRDKSISVWFESADLAELLKEDSQSLIDEELKRFPKEFVFIEQ